MNRLIKEKNSITILILCLSISVLIWLSMSLSRTYTKTYDFLVTYDNIPINKKITNDSIFIKTILATTGWDLLLKNTKKRKLRIDLNEYIVDKTLTFPNTTILLKEAFQDLNIKETSPISFTLGFQVLETKKVPVKLNYETDFNTNFFLSKETIITPDSVEISSDSKTLSQTNFIETELFKISQSNTLMSKIGLLINPHIKSNIHQIDANFTIEEFAEKEFRIPVTIENKPKKVDLIIYPEEIIVKCQLAFSVYEKITASDFYISADFNNIEPQNNNYLSVYLKEKPKYTKNIRMNKNKIEYIIYQ